MDGHDGDLVSEYIEKHFKECFMKEWDKEGITVSSMLTLEQMTVFFKQLFITIDVKLCIEEIKGGSTLVVSVSFCLDGQMHIFVANTGDSVANLLFKDQVIALTPEHNTKSRLEIM